MHISRKTLLAVGGILLVILTFLKDQFGLSAGFMAAVLGLGTAMGYVFFEAKADLKKVYSQAHRWRDPKFWLGLAAVLLAGVNTVFGLALPVEAIVAVLGIIMAVLFGKQLMTA
jgi:hypothetical protein